MSFHQEAVFQNNVLVRQIINHLINGPAILLHIALINKKFNEEICSRLRQIKSLDFYSIKNEQLSSSSSEMDKSEVEGEVEVEIEVEIEKEEEGSSIQYGFNQILCNNLSIFYSNLSFVTHQSPIISLNFHDLKNDDLKLDSLLRLKGIQSLSFHPSQRHTSNVIYHELIDKNLTTLQTLSHPPENFLKSLLRDDACLKLDYLEINIDVLRSMHYGIREKEDVYLFEVKKEFEDILEKKLKVKSLTLHGHNRARFQSIYYTLLTEANVSTLKMICDEPIVMSEDLIIFQEWKNRNKRFPQIIDFELIFWDDILKTHYDTAMILLLDVFPHLTKIKFGSQKSYSADECFEIIESIKQYWKKNILDKREHHIHLNAVIPKEQQNNFELRLQTHKSYRNLSKSCNIWFYTMRINIENCLQINFQFL
uniref:DUF38 domain-containing protein n=1 Tax=Panagrolaimus superbus TaxID=310955 RepID=A0A914YBY2_9BILA